MKLKSILIILLSALSLAAFAQQPQKKVAVYVRGGEDGVNRALASELVTAFTQSDQYIAVERTESFLAELSKEVSYQQSGAVSDNDIARLGNQFGVQLVCVVHISKIFDEQIISARLIAVEKAEVMKSADVYSALASRNDVQRVSQQLRTKLFGDAGTNKNIPKGYVDLGLTSGTLWEEKEKNGQFNYEEAVQLAKDMGGDIPTKTQWQELADECTWTQVTDGWEVQGSNGNNIFLSHVWFGLWTSTLYNSSYYYVFKASKFAYIGRSSHMFLIFVKKQ